MKRAIIKAAIIIAATLLIFMVFIYSMRWWILDFLCWLWQLAD